MGPCGAPAARGLEAGRQNLIKMSNSSSMSSAWEPWLDMSLLRLQSANLLRTQRPIIAMHSSHQAMIPERDLLEWAESLDHHHMTERQVADASPSNRQLTLFSLNDYLGLASHPEVCEAAASASQHLGMGPRSSAVVG